MKGARCAGIWCKRWGPHLGRTRATAAAPRSPGARGGTLMSRSSTHSQETSGEGCVESHRVWLGHG